MLTEQERAELDLLNLANEKGKFAVPMIPYMGHLADPFTRGVDEEWFRLIDVCPAPHATGNHQLVRVFRLTEAGIAHKAELQQKEIDDNVFSESYETTTH